MSNKDFTTDFSEGEHHSPSLHDAGIEPSGQGDDFTRRFGESDVHYQLRKNRYLYAKQCECERCKEIVSGYDKEKDEISLLSRQLLRSEQKNQAKNEEIQRLREALNKIVSMKLKPGETDYRYAFNRTWHIASEALNPSSKTDK